MAHPGLPLLHLLLLEEAVVEIKDSQHSREHHGPLIPTLHQDNNLYLIYFSKRGSPLSFLSQMSMCTSSNLLDAEHDTVLGHACGESVFSCQFEAGWTALVYGPKKAASGSCRVYIFSCMGFLFQPGSHLHIGETRNVVVYISVQNSAVACRVGEYSQTCLSGI